MSLKRQNALCIMCSHSHGSSAPCIGISDPFESTILAQLLVLAKRLKMEMSRNEHEQNSSGLSHDEMAAFDQEWELLDKKLRRVERLIRVLR